MRSRGESRKRVSQTSRSRSVKASKSADFTGALRRDLRRFFLPITQAQLVRNDRLEGCRYRCVRSCEVTGSPDEPGAAFSASRASSTKLRSLLYRPPRIMFRGEMLPSMGF